MRHFLSGGHAVLASWPEIETGMRVDSQKRTLFT